MKIKISTDSTADIPKSFCEEWNISVLPLTIIHEGKEYRDGIDIDINEFYNILEKAAVLPGSAQVGVPLYLDLFNETFEAGYTDIIHVTLNGKGSGTFQAGILAKDMFMEEHPGADFNIQILDSTTYSMAYGIPVVEAAQMAAKGEDVDTIVNHLNECFYSARPMFVPLDLKCVKKSGRISAAAAFAGDALGLKPLITFEDGDSKIVSKVRGEKKAVAALVELCLKERVPGTNYALVHGKDCEAYEQLKAEVNQKFDIAPMCEYPVGCIIGINTGPNMIGILYRRKM